ncbi:cytochrome b5 reductase [Cavenderia fasciculata]|uniref:Cytochrome b5 reductase n=1 Tax=Cavenderia fasciculata TaxID=261658 RepID=F4QF79_CACFS|nr:cytochrome b5 reductase [Cavenderia fasciculata]EGG14233.1 cytochrome b5 reductase [Cavenderia fasciculata]|eukprot:XP_004350942.1 cytochrome b5 reductase [Cavenderia fasciculata]
MSDDDDCLVTFEIATSLDVKDNTATTCELEQVSEILMNRPNTVSERIRNVATEALAKYNGKLGQTYDWDEISKHNTKTDFWTVVGAYVYDLTAYLNYHPGGFNLLFRIGGQNGTNDFEAMFHSKNARLILECFCIGRLKGGATSSSSSKLQQPQSSMAAPSLLSPSYRAPPPPSSLPPKLVPSSSTSSSTLSISSTTTSLISTLNIKDTNINNHQKSSTISTSISFKMFEGKIISKEMASSDSFHLQVEIPTEKTFNQAHHWVHPLTHVSVANNNNEFNSYTPINASVIGNKTHLYFLIKSYTNGNISRYLSTKTIGDTLRLRGPIKTHQEFKLDNYSHPYLVCIAGGTGITPIIQMLNVLFPLEEKEKEKEEKVEIETNQSLFDSPPPPISISTTSSSSSSSSSTTISLQPKPHLILIYSNSKSSDILYKKELETIQQKYHTHFTLYHVITKEEEEEENNNNININNNNNNNQDTTTNNNNNRIKTFYGQRLGFELLRKCYMNHESLTLENNSVVLCGPLAFNQSLSDQLSTIGYEKNKLIILE